MTELTGPRGAVRRVQRAAPVSIEQHLIAFARRDVDGLYAFGVCLTMLFIIQLGTKGGLLLVALVLGYAALRRAELGELLFRRGFVLAIPAFAILSAAWSDLPRDSLKYGAELGLTAFAGLLLSSARKQDKVIFGLLAAFAIYGAVALAFGRSVSMGAMGARAFSGLTEGKNLLGEITSLGVLAGSAAGAIALRKRQMLWMAASGAAILLQLYVCLAAHSAGALVGLALATATFVGLAVVRHLSSWAKGGVMGLVGAVGVGVAMSYSWLTDLLVEAASRYFDKDPTLTGRTYIWYRAEGLIAERPWLGRGYHAFWVQGNPEAEGLWRWAGISARQGFTFHNTSVEVLVHLGRIGLTVCVAVLIISAIGLVVRYIRHADLALCFWIGLLVYSVSRMPIESIGLVPFYFSTALLFAALGAAVAPARVGDRRETTLRPEVRARASVKRVQSARPATKVS